MGTPASAAAMACHDLGEYLLVFLDLFIVFQDWVLDILTSIYYIRTGHTIYGVTAIVIILIPGLVCTCSWYLDTTRRASANTERSHSEKLWTYFERFLMLFFFPLYIIQLAVREMWKYDDVTAIRYMKNFYGILGS